MASISREPKGRKTIQFRGADGKRRSIRLGKVSMRHVEAFKTRVEHLVAASMTGHALDDETARWVAKLDKVVADKLTRVGLIQVQHGSSLFRLGEFLDDYLAGRTDVGPSTRRHLKQAADNLIAFFGPEKPLREITPGDADEFRLYLLRRLGPNTTARMCGRAKQLFRRAHRKQLIPENPFGDMKGCSVKPNNDRDYFVTRDKVYRVLEACPDAQWRLLVALCRYGGLRCPSEPLLVKWVDVNWERDRIRVTSPKTKHQGKAERIIPLFPELRPHLEAVWDEAPEGAEFVITRYRNTNANLRTQLLRIIRRAGLEPWPKLFQNLRATRETELAEEYALQTVTAWLGNTPTVALKHYLQVREEDFERAIADGLEPGQEQTTQNPTQSVHAKGRKGLQSNLAAHEETPVLQGLTSSCNSLPDEGMPPQGLEP